MSMQTAAMQDWREQSPGALIDHILVRYHARHREQLPELIRMARRVEEVHATSGDCPHGLAAHLLAMEQELVSHMQKEEQILFPMLSRGMAAMAGGPISVMRMEHDTHDEALRQLDTLTHDQTPPASACNTWRTLYAALREFRDDLRDHIELENNVLFDHPARA